MSQIQVTGEAKIRDIQGPVVANSGVITALDGLPSQFVRGDGTLADIPSVTGGGASVSYYLNGSVSQGTFGGSTYYQLGENAITGVGTNFSTSTNGLIAQFITDADVPDLTEIPSGNWNIEFYMGVSASSGALASFYVEVYKYDGTTFTLIASNVGTPEFLTNTTTIDAYFTSVAMPLTSLAVTDRIAIRVYASVAGKTVTMYTEDNRLCQVVTTFSRGMLSLNSLTDQQQYLTVGTAGTDFNIVSALDTHTFNIPSASATNRGLITTGTQTIAGNKGFTGTANFVGGAFFPNNANFIKDSTGITPLVGYVTPYITSWANGFVLNLLDGSSTFKSSLKFDNSADFDYTFPNASGTITLLEENQNVTGFKQFSDAAGTALDYGFSVVKGNTPSSLSSSQVSVYSTIGNKNLVIADTFSSFAKLEFQSTGNYTYTFPALNGTVVTDYGNWGFHDNISFEETATFYKGLNLRNLTPPTFFDDLWSTLYSVSGSNNLVVRNDLSNAKLEFNNSTQTYTFPALSGTIALLEGSQTFTGTKTFSADPIITSTTSAYLKINSAIGNTSSVAFTVNNTNVGFIDVNASQFSFRNYVSNQFRFVDGFMSNGGILAMPSASLQTYTFPASSGTVALTSNLSAYLPLTGGTLTGTLNGTFGIFSVGVYGFGLQAQGDVTNAGVLQLKHTGSVSVNSGNVAIAADSSNTIGFYFAGSSTAKLSNASLTATRTYTLPDASGTLALTSNLSAYLPLSGGTLTGALSGTSATFTSNVTIRPTSGYNAYFQTSGTAVRINYLNDALTTNVAAAFRATDFNFQDGSGSTVLSIASTGAATFNSSVTANAYINNYNDQGALRLYNTASAFAGGIGNGAWVEGTATTDIAIYSANNMKFYAGGSSTSKMTITSGGNVGIGTSTFNYSSAGRGYLAINGSSNSILEFQIGSAASGYIYSNASNLELNANGDRWLQFTTNGSERMRITSGGNIGIGTSNPVSKLQIGTATVYPSGGYTFQMSNGSTEFLITLNSAQVGSSTTFYSSTDYYFNRSGPLSTGIITAYGFNNISDYRMKENLSSYNPFDIINNIKTYKYDMIDTKETQYGVLAHEVQEILPHIVVGVKDGDRLQSVDYSKIVPILVKAIQELQSQINEIKAK